MGRIPGKREDGKIKLPSVDGAMNRVAPARTRSGRRGDSDTAKPLGEEKRDKATRHQKILERALKRMKRSISGESENRKDALDDLKMKKGDQWPSDILAQRALDKRPCQTINKLPTFVRQITNNLRQNRPSININPVGDRSDPAVAKMYRGLIRAIERDSAADIAYDTGADNAVSNGFGYWRVLTEREQPDSFNQVIVLRRIRNPFSVYLDPNHVEPDGSDAKWGFISDLIPREEFEADYPNADPMPWNEAGIGETMKAWMTKDEIRIAEYFEIEDVKRTLVKLDTGHEGWEDELNEKTLELIDEGEVEVIDRLEATEPKVRWYKLTAKDVLSERDWAGKWIPIVKIIGDEVDIEGKVTYSGVIRHAKDPQRMYNYWTTKQTEAIALSPNAPWVMEEGQIEGHEDAWLNANIRSSPVLLYKATSVSGRPAPPPQRQPFAGIPAGVVQAIQGAAQDMQATTGIRFDATQQERTIDESGKALRELRSHGDLGAFHYTDNMARSLRHTGNILVDLIPKIYDTKRVITILREDDTEEQVAIDPHMATPTGEQRLPQAGGAGQSPMPGGPAPGGAMPGAPMAGGPMAGARPGQVSKAQQTVRKVFNLKYGRYGVTVTVGPSYATKRIEASENMIAFAHALPQTAALFADLIAKNQDWPDAEIIAARIAKTLPANLLTPDDKDMSPQMQALIQSMDGQIKQLTQQLQQAVVALTDKEKDRALVQMKLEHDFELRLLKIVSDMETKMAATQERAVSNFNTHIGAQVRDLGTHVTTLVHALEKPPAEKGAAGGNGKDATA